MCGEVEAKETDQESVLHGDLRTSNGPTSLNSKRARWWGMGGSVLQIPDL